MKNEEKIIKHILKYINENYNLNVILKTNFTHKNNIFIITKKYDLNIFVERTNKNHYLFNQKDYVLYFDYEANKKYREELSWCGGGHSEGYDENDFSNIDNFLKRWCSKKEYKQITIFDLEESE